MPRVFHVASVIVAVVAFAACGRPPQSGAPAGNSSTSSAPAVAASVPQPPAINVAQLDSMIRKTVASKKLVGLSVGVMQNGKVVLAKGYGVRTLGTQDSVTAETMFAVGSVTKQFTCSSALLLAQDGKLSMQDPVAKYYPNLTRAGDITLLELGQHVSGYRDYYPLDFVDREMQRDEPPDSIINEYATRPLDFDPGTRWSYSNTNFLILGRVVEKVSGKSYGDFVSERIFTPVGMTHTQYEPAHGGPTMANGYTTFALGPAIPAQPEAKGWAATAGGIWSTPSDLLAWDLALIDGKVLNSDSYRTLTTPRHLADGRSTGYGCGDGVRDQGPAVVLTHGGAVSGFVAQNIAVPATRSAVVTLANTDFASLDSLHETILAKLVPPHVDVPAINGPAAVAAARTFLVALQQGKVDRSTLGDDYSAFLTPELVAGAQKSLGPITDVEVAQTAERGGMEVASIRFKTGGQPARALMYRTPDGKIQEVLFERA
jgi:CubicO group peptidase (beta-lactamase class C family)